MRKLLAYLIAATGGILSQVLADAWNLGGAAAYGLFLGCVAIVVLIAVPLSDGFGPGRRRDTSAHSPL
jgi:hypothetical protein